jgi:hypothetical protein
MLKVFVVFSAHRRDLLDRKRIHLSAEFGWRQNVSQIAPGKFKRKKMGKITGQIFFLFVARDILMPFLAPSFFYPSG